MPVQKIGQLIVLLESVDSSNNYAMQEIQAGRARHGTVFFALEQTAGKGQPGKQWTSRKGENITISIVLETTTLGPDTLFPLNMAMALGVYDFVFQKAGEQFSVKWPNDIFWRDRKAGGILIENKWLGANWQFAIVGIGLNLNQVEFDAIARNPVSLRQISGETYDLQELLPQLFEALENRWQQLVSGDYAGLHRSYNEVLYCKGEEVWLKSRGQEFLTRILKAELNGELLTEDSQLRRFRSGEVQWVPVLRRS